MSLLKFEGFHFHMHVFHFSKNVFYVCPRNIIYTVSSQNLWKKLAPVRARMCQSWLRCMCYVLFGEYEHKLLSLRFHCTHECLFFHQQCAHSARYGIRLASTFIEEKIRAWASDISK